MMPHEAAVDAVVALCGADVLPLHILDVGANPIEGDVSYKALLDRGLVRVTGFEPQAAALEELNRRKGPLETYRPEALGNGQAARLHLTRVGGFTSVFPADRGAARLLGWNRAMSAARVETIDTRRLDDLDLGAPVDFLKIDVQGSETAIIAHGARTLAAAVAVQTEVRFLPIYAGEPSFGDLDATLRAQGFAFHSLMHLKRVALRSPHAARLRRLHHRQIVDGDAVYLRNLTRIGEMSDRQLLAVAILGIGALDSASAAVLALDTLAARGRIGAADVDRVIDGLPDALAAPAAEVPA
jgi:FkbM family methyltransferase